MTTQRPTPALGAALPRHRARRPRPRPRPLQHRLVLALAVVMAAGLTMVGVSYVRALTAPGYASWVDRTAGWVREYGGGSLVNAAENWYYTRHAPSTTPPGPASLPHGPRVVVPAAATLPRLPNLSGLPGESMWVAGRTARDGQPAAFHSYFQPDPAHAGVIVGVSVLRAGATTAHLMAGTAQPGGAWPGGAHVPAPAVPNLVATFNSGYKFADHPGGFYSHGRTGRALVPGAASLVINDRGAISVGAWGRDVVMSPHVVSVRQNLDLIVHGGHPVAGLVENIDGRWGSARSQYQYTWRSGIGVDSRGNAIYVAGNHLNLPTLAQAMAQAGIVTGMQLDIHSGMATYAWWTPNRGGVVAHKLLPDMPSSSTRYLAADQRDFLYVTVK